MKILIFLIIGVVLLTIIAEVLYIAYAGTPVPSPNVSSEPVNYGSKGDNLLFVVLGDSISVAQGGNYDQGIAVTAARRLAEKYKVELVNIGVSGARSKDVLEQQLPRISELKPDVVLLVISANDITHFTSLAEVEKDIRSIISTLKSQNPSVKIITTGTPAMGSIARFPWPVNVTMGARANAMNKRFSVIVEQENISFARIAERTGKQFAEDDSLFASDKFHPSDSGYALWSEVIIEQIDLVENIK